MHLASNPLIVLLVLSLLFISYNVSYSDDNSRCLAILKIGMQSQENPEVLTIMCTVVGEFLTGGINSEKEKKQVHVETYQQLFPYGQTLLSHLCTEALLPPFYFPKINMTTEDVIING